MSAGSFRTAPQPRSEVGEHRVGHERRRLGGEFSQTSQYQGYDGINRLGPNPIRKPGSRTIALLPVLHFKPPSSPPSLPARISPLPPTARQARRYEPQGSAYRSAAEACPTKHELIARSGLLQSSPSLWRTAMRLAGLASSHVLVFPCL